MTATTPTSGDVINRLSTANPEFRASLDRLLSWEPTEDRDVEATVRDIIRDVRTRGEAAVVAEAGAGGRQDRSEFLHQL